MNKNILTLFILISFTIPFYGQSNLLTNPGFEDSVNVGWRLNAWGGAEAELKNETGSNVIAGDISAKVEVTTAAPDKIEKVSLMSDTIFTAPQNGNIFISAYAKTETQQFLPFKLSVKCENEAGNKKWYAGDEVFLTTSARLVTFTVSPDPDYRAKIWLRLSCGEKTGNYLFDDVVFSAVAPDTLPVPEGRRLREIVADKYPDGNVFIGGASLNGLWGGLSEEIMNREFGYITPANDFKQTYIHPEPGVFRWDYPDEWVQKAAENNQVVRMHSPISPQCSQWAKEDSRTPEELLQNLEEYMTALCERYNGNENIVWMDVVNETLDKNTGEWFGPKPGTDKWENPWTIIGFDTTYSNDFQPPLYIKRAFEIATEKAPDIKHIINQHGTVDDVVWDKIKKLVVYLRSKGLRVDGVGFQAHVDAGWENENDNIEKLAGLISWAHQNGLEFHITENNVFLRNGNEGDWEAQAATFKAILETVVAARETGTVTWNVWMIRDGDGQQAARTPVLFFDDGSAKPAYYAVQSVLEEAPTGVKTEIKPVPQKFKLYNNYPNPFSKKAGGNPTTKISFTIMEQSFVKLEIYNSLGEHIHTLVDENLGAGTYIYQFNAVNLASGVYFYSLSVNGFREIKKMNLIK